MPIYEPLRRASEVEVAVRSAGFFDLELSNAAAIVANPDHIVTYPRDREPLENTIVPAVGAVLLNRAGDITRGTVTFGMQGDSINACRTVIDSWFDSVQGLPKSKLRELLSSDAIKATLYDEARDGYTCAIGGVAVLKEQGSDNIKSIPFVNVNVIEALERIQDTTYGRMTKRVMQGVQRARGKSVDSRPETQALGLLAQYSRVATPRHRGEPVIVDRPLLATI